METSKIEWTDATFNPWIGCTKVSAGCAHCYAEADMDKRRGRVAWGPAGSRSMTSPDYWRQPIKWNAEAEAAGVAKFVFCASLADVFEDWPGRIHSWHAGDPGVLWHRDDIGVVDAGGTTVGNVRGERLATMQDIRWQLFKLCEATPWLTWLLLTKRPENILNMVPISWMTGWPANVWAGISAEDQASLDARWLHLAKVPAPLLFLSAEPLLGPLDARPYLESSDGFCNWPRDCGPVHYQQGGRGFRWVIAGGESGPHARPFHPEHVRALRDQCEAIGTDFLFKQWGEWASIHDCGHVAQQIDAGKLAVGEWHDDGPFIPGCICGAGHGTVVRVGKAAAGRLLDGREWNGRPGATFGQVRGQLSVAQLLRAYG